MELSELFGIIQKTLGEEGFSLSKITRNSMERSYFVLDNELEIKKLDPAIKYTVISGNCLEVRIAPHRNGAKADTSYYIEIDDVDRGSFRTYKQIKLKRAQLEPTLVRKIKAFANEYKNYLKEKEWARKLELYLSLAPEERNPHN